MSNTRELSEGNDFEKPFQDKLSDLEDVPPLDWRTMEMLLDREKRGVRRWHVSAALLLLLVSTLGFVAGYLTKSYNVSQPVITSVDAGLAVVEVPQSNAALQSAEACVEEEACPVESQPEVRTSAGPIAEKPDREESHRADRGPHKEERSNRGGSNFSALNEQRHQEARARKEAQYAASRQRGEANDGRLSNNKSNADGEDQSQSIAIRDLVREPSGKAKHLADSMRADKTRRMTSPGIDRADTSESIAQRNVNGSFGEDRKKGVTSDDDSVENTIPIDKSFAKFADDDSVKTVKEEKQSKPGKWVFQVHAGGNYLFKKITPEEDLYYLTRLANKNTPSWHNVGYQLGLSIRKPVSSRTTVLAGLSFNRFQERTAYDYYDVVADSTEIRNIANNIIEVNTFFKKRSNDVVNTVTALSVRVGMVQKVTVLGHSHAVLLEMNLHKKLNANVSTDEETHRFVVNPTWFSVKAGLEKVFILSERQRMTFTPYVMQSLQSVYGSQSVYGLKPLLIGIDVGLQLPLRKMK